MCSPADWKKCVLKRRFDGDGVTQEYLASELRDDAHEEHKEELLRYYNELRSGHSVRGSGSPAGRSKSTELVVEIVSATLNSAKKKSKLVCCATLGSSTSEQRDCVLNKDSVFAPPSPVRLVCPVPVPGPGGAGAAADDGDDGGSYVQLAVFSARGRGADAFSAVRVVPFAGIPSTRPDPKACALRPAPGSKPFGRPSTNSVEASIWIREVCARATYDFPGTNARELSFKAGDEIVGIDKVSTI